MEEKNNNPSDTQANNPPQPQEPQPEPLAQPPVEQFGADVPQPPEPEPQQAQAVQQNEVPGGIFPPSEAAAPTSPETAPQTPESITAIRALLIKLLLGSVVAAAVVAVVAILLGSFGGVAWRAIGTIISAIVHIGILFAVLSTSSNGDPRSVRSGNAVLNVAMTIAVLSFFTSIFWIWDVIGFSISSKLFVTYAVVLFAIIHAKSLMDMAIINEKLKPYVAANYVAIATVATLILGVVYLPSNFELLSGFYGRLLAAAVVIDVTLGIVVAVMQKLHIQKHPDQQLDSSHGSGALGIIRLVAGLLFFFFVVLPLLNVAISAAR